MIWSLMSHNEARRGMTYWTEKHQPIFTMIRETIGLQQFSVEDIDTVLGIFLVNDFEINAKVGEDEWSSQGQNSLRGLFQIASIPNHDCLANTVHTFESIKDGFRMTVRAGRVIKKGSEITVNYYFNNDEDRGQFCLTYEQRRIKVAESYRFKCLCSECNQNGKNDNLRLRYQQMDLQLEPGFKDIDSTIKVLKTAESKLELGRMLDHQVLFRDLMDCLIPLKCLMEVYTMEVAECSPEVMAECADKFEKMKEDLLRVGAVIPKQFIRKVKSMLRLE